MEEPLYIGIDLSTQQLKAIVVTSRLKAIQKVKFDFDADSSGYQISKGVISNSKEHEVYAPIALWLQALDEVLRRLRETGIDLARVRGISAAGQQHGSVYWNVEAAGILGSLDSSKTLVDQVQGAFSHPYSPNWQDASTQSQCEVFDVALGDEVSLAQMTGSKAHHRFTGPQILRFQQKHPEAYQRTARISLVSSFVASVLSGRIAPFDIADVCGMNLYDVRSGRWDERLLKLAAGDHDVRELRAKLGEVPEDGGFHLGPLSPYFVERYGFSPDCTVVVSTGDNPATILALPLRAQDAIVSLGTSTTFLMSTSEYKPDPATHFMNHPTTAGLYMFMLCYKNGGLAREKVRDAMNTSIEPQNLQFPWARFDETLSQTPPLCQRSSGDTEKLGLYFPRPEIVPNLPCGQWHFAYNEKLKELTESEQGWIRPEDDVRAIVESQMLSLRLRSKDLVSQPSPEMPAQPRRIYLVGGSSRNRCIAKVVGQVLGGSEGIYRLDVGENACALGAAYKAVWSVERRHNETFEDLIGARWDESDFVERVADGYQKGVFEQYGEALERFKKMEDILLERYSKGRSIKLTIQAGDIEP